MKKFLSIVAFAVITSISVAYATQKAAPEYSDSELANIEALSSDDGYRYGHVKHLSQDEIAGDNKGGWICIGVGPYICGEE